MYRPARAARLAVLAIITVLGAATGTHAAQWDQAPGSPAAVALSSSAIRVTWTDTNSQENGYSLERSLSSSGPWTEIWTSGANATSRDDTGLAAGTRYYYRIRSFKDSGSQSNPTRSYGTYSATVSAQTFAAATTTSTSTSTTSSTVSASNLPPVANAGADRSASVGQVLTFSSSGSYDPDGSIVAYMWNWGDGSAWGNTATATHAYTSAGTKTVTLWVQDNKGTWDSDTAVVTVGSGGTTTSTSSTTSTSKTTTTSTSSSTSTTTAVSNPPPVANAGPDRQVVVALPIVFDGTGSTDPNGSIVAYSWQFGDGGTASTATPTHAYATAGTYTVTLWVQDNGGVWDSDTALVTVTAGGASEWSQRYGGTLTDVGNNAAASDAAGNVVIAGTFQNSASFGGSTLTSAGLQDGFVAKYSATGVHLWSKRFGGTSNETVDGLAVSSTGDVFVTGGFTGTTNLGGANLVNAATTGTWDVYVAKYSGATGAHLWSKRYGEAYDDIGFGVAVDTAGNPYLIGRFVWRIDFGGGPISSPGNSFLAKLSGTNGAHLWSRNFGSGGVDESISVAVDASGNPVVAGRFNYTVDCGGGPLTSAGGWDIYVAKFAAANGSHQWSRRAGGAYGDEVKSVAVDGSGEVYITGVFEQSTNLGGSTLTASGNNDTFVAKYAASGGAHRWSKNFTSTGNDWGLRAAWNASGGEIVVTGFFEGTLNPGTGTLTSAGTRDIFAVGLNASGATQWAVRYGSSTNDEGHGVTATPTGAVLLTGFFTGSVNFGTGTLTSAGGGDVFLRSLVP